MNEKRPNFFLHDWKTDKRFMIKLRKKKRIEISNKKRYMDIEEKKDEKSGASDEVSGKLRDLCNTSDDNAKIICLELLENTQFLESCVKTEVIEKVSRVLNKYSLETTGLLFELLVVLSSEQFVTVHKILENGMLMHDIEFLFKLSVLGHIDFLMASDTLKFILDQAASSNSPVQLLSLQIIREILYSSEENSLFLIEIGVLELFHTLLTFNSIPIIKELLLSLSHLILGPVCQVSKTLYSSIPPILPHLPALYLSLSPEIDEFLNISIQTCMFHSLTSEFFSILTTDFYPILQQVLITYPKHLTSDFLSFLNNLLAPSLPAEHFESFIDSGCYNALEYCTILSPEGVSSAIQEILDSHFA